MLKYLLVNTYLGKSLFIMAYKNLPDLRFNGFSDEWKEIKFSEIYTKSYGGGTPSKKNQDFWNDGTIPWFQSSDLVEGKLTKENVNKKISEKSIVKSSVKVIPGGSIAIVTRVGVGKLALIDFDYSTSQDFLSISGFKTKTMYALYLIYNLMNVLKNSLQGTSIKGITKPELNSKRIRISTDSLEQQKIGSFFEKLDKLIELQTQKVDQLKKLKRGYLQKMFPQEGETVPRLRFSGFSVEWKEDRLGNYSHIIGGGTPSTSNDKYWNGNINWFSPIEIGENKYVSNSTKKISDIGLKKSSAKILPEGSLLFTSRAGIGKTAILLKEACTNQGFQSIVPIDGRLDIEFLYAISYKLKNYGNKMGSGSTFTEVSGKTMSKMKLRLPNVDEQQKIGNFFAKLDRLIEQQSKKLDQLKQQKKAYLQKMFI